MTPVDFSHATAFFFDGSLFVVRRTQPRNRRRREWKPALPLDGIVQAQWPHRTGSAEARPIQQRGFKRYWRLAQRGRNRGRGGLVEFFRWRLGGGSCLSGKLLHAVSASRPRGNSAVGNYLLPFVERYAAVRPVDVISNAIGNVRRSCQCKAHDPRVIVVEASIVGCHDGVMLGYPLQFLCIRHSTGYHGIWIDRPIRGGRVIKKLAQGQKAFTAQLSLAERRRTECLRLKK